MKFIKFQTALSLHELSRLYAPLNTIETFQIHDQKIDYSNVKSRAGANDNVGHKAGGRQAEERLRLAVQ